MTTPPTSITLATFAAQPGGVWRHVADLAGALAARGHDVSVAVPDHAEDLIARARGAGLRVVGLDDASADVWHVHLHDTLERQALAALLRRLPGRAATVATEHLPRSHASDPTLLPGGRTPGAHTAKTIMKRAGLAATDRTILVSDASRRFVQRRYRVGPGRLRVVLNAGRDVEAAPRHVPRDGTGDVVVIAVGSLIMQKGMDVLVDAAVGARGWSARILGDGPHRAALEERAARAGAAAELLGWREGALEQMAAADVFCLPSRWEACPYVVLEAMAVGVPVVATAVDGVPELVADGETGRLVAHDDPVALRAALDALAADPALRARMGAAGVERVRREHRFDAMVDATEAVYAEALAARRRRAPWRRA